MTRFQIYHYLLPLICFAALAFCFEFFQWDIVLADYLYHAQGGNGWALREHPITEQYLHRHGALLIKFLEISCCLGLLWCYRNMRYRHYARPLLYLLFSTLTCAGVIAVLKGITHVDCPWSLLRYAGERPYIPIFEEHPGTFHFGRGFPSGHAGSGFAWIALYYFFILMNEDRYRYHGLGFGLLLGIVFGISQQLRGAHFISHDIWALGICWCIASLSFVAFKKTKTLTTCISSLNTLKDGRPIRNLIGQNSFW